MTTSFNVVMKTRFAGFAYPVQLCSTKHTPQKEQSQKWNKQVEDSSDIVEPMMVPFYAVDTKIDSL